MKVTLFYIATAFFLLSAGPSRINGTLEADPGLDSFLNEFTHAVESKNKARIVALLDPGFKLEQHDKYYRGKTDKFLDNFFCGSIVSGNGTKCLKFKKIVSIEIASKDEGGTSIPVVFRVSEKKVKVDVIMTVKIRITDGVKEYGIVGAVG